MNSTSQDAQTRRLDAPPSVDEVRGQDALSELIEVEDPTEDLANDVTSELPGSSPGPGTRLHIVLPQLAASVSVAANDETGGAEAAIAAGAVLRDRYRLGPPLGLGGTSIVFRARDSRRSEANDEGAEVAIKLLRPELRDQPHCIARLKREFHQTQSLAHPNVVRFYDLDCDRGSWFIAMELLDGEALGRRLRRESPGGLPAGDALRIAAACGNALAFAHDHGVMHGDVKPDNVFITSSGDIRMLDFGVAPESDRTPLPASLAEIDPVVGAATRAYASPEVLAGQAPESRDDVFSLACVTYEMLAGRHPFGRRGADEARQTGLAVARPPGLSTQQWRGLSAGLAWSRDERLTVRELVRALGNDSPEPVPTQAEAVPVIVPSVRGVEAGQLRRPHRPWRGLAFISVAVILGVLVGRFAFGPQGDSHPEAASAPMTAASIPAGSLAGSIALPTHEATLEHPVPVTPQEVSTPTVETGAHGSPAPGLVAFDSATMTVSRRAVIAPIPVRHSSSTTRSVMVAWRVVAGTALAGRDYGGPESGVGHFSEGHTFRMIFVPLLRDANATDNRSFTVELTGVSSGARLGVKNRIVVTILGDA